MTPDLIKMDGERVTEWDALPGWLSRIAARNYVLKLLCEFRGSRSQMDSEYRMYHRTVWLALTPRKRSWRMPVTISSRHLPAKQT